MASAFAARLSVGSDSSSANNKRESRLAMQSIVRAVALGKQVETGHSRLTILDDVSFDIVAGEAVALVGASGSGKTTLLGLLAGLDVPSAGQVLIDNQD